MKNPRKYTIAILDDSQFYNLILTAKLRGYTNEIEQEKNITFNIISYTHPHDFLLNLNADTNLVILDYYLGEGITGTDVLRDIASKCDHCKVLILSNANTMKTSLLTILEGASGFILKDKHALENTCIALEDIMRTQGYF